MDCKYVRQQYCISFRFHPEATSLFSLVHYKNRLRIVQENLYTGLLINSFPVPLCLQNLDVDNYILNFNEHLNLIVLTLSNCVVIYSVEKKVLELVAQAQGKNPYYIVKTVTKNKYFYFACPEQRNVYAINLEECIRQGSITNYIKYKISSEVEVVGLALYNKTLVALCSDSVIRMWDVETQNSLRGAAIEGIGRPHCLSFSKDGQYLLIGSYQGFIQAWDGPALGVKNTKIMSEKISNTKIQSLSWFHYSGENQSHRFLAYTMDGSVKLFSFGLEKKDDVYIGKCQETSLLYISKHKMESDFVIETHPFANFIFFSPGILLYMVDTFPLFYYPITVKPFTYSFEQITPNEQKQVFYQRDHIFMEGEEIKRLTDKVQHRLSLNDLQLKDLKVLKLDVRPMCIKPTDKSKFMLVYYLKNCVRAFTISNVNMNQENAITSYKEYNGSWIMFVGSPNSYNSFIMIVQDDRQTITVLAEGTASAEELKEMENQEEKRYLEMGQGQIYTKKINIKIDKVYSTPFRNNYVVIYQCENLLRFSSNINFDSEMVNFQVFTGYSVRLDYTDIIIDVIWTSKGQLGAVICLDKIVFISCELKFMKSVNINGYVVQGQWIGFTLLVTTKVDVQYLDILSKPLQAFCIQNFQSCKYLVLGVMTDRIFGIEKSNKKINIKSRYFNMMEPIVSGYLNYQRVAENPIDQIMIKRVIECYAPYFIVSQQFLALLNDHNLAHFSMFFLQGNQKMYSRSIRAATLNKCRKMQRFIPESIWHKNKKALLDLFLFYEEAKDSSDPFEKEKIPQYVNRIKHVIGDIAFDSIESISKTGSFNESNIKIDNNFGEKTLTQLFYDIKEGSTIKMEIQPFRAQNIGEWIGQFGTFIQSKPYYSDDVNGPIVDYGMSQNENEDSADDDEENEFKDLVVYCRIDDGKGSTAQDLSDYGNHATLIGSEESWTILNEQPMQVEDKWGKKCPPQYSLNCMISFDKKINSRSFKKGCTIQLWIRPISNSFNVLQNEKILCSVKNKSFMLFVQQNEVHLKELPSKADLLIEEWFHIAIILAPDNKMATILINSMGAYEGKFDKFDSKPPQSMQVGSDEGSVEYTELRIWRKVLDDKEIRENMRLPLEMVSQKRKKLMRERKKKQKVQKKQTQDNPFSFPL